MTCNEEKIKYNLKKVKKHWKEKGCQELYHMVNVITSLWPPVWVGSNDKVVWHITCQSIIFWKKI